jgi:hypothetical protein
MMLPAEPGFDYSLFQEGPLYFKIWGDLKMKLKEARNLKKKKIIDVFIC